MSKINGRQKPTIKSIAEYQPVISMIMDLIERHFGSHCEILLHDFSKEYEHTIVDIRNGHITGRTLGGCATNLGLEIMRGTTAPEDTYNYITYAPNGRMLRSSSIFFQDAEGKPVGSLCFNLDITDTVYLEKLLGDYNNTNAHNTNPPSEFFPENVHELLDMLINQAIRDFGKAPKLLSKEEKMEFISFLDSKGAFIVTKSSEKVCTLLGISKYTFYNYLDSVRKNQISSDTLPAIGK